MMLKRLRPLLIACLAAATLSPQRVALARGDLDDAKAVAQEVITKTLNDKQFLKDCFQMPALPRNCNEGDTPGATLVCPPAPPSPGREQQCSVMDSRRFQATLGAKGRQIFKLASEFVVNFVIFGVDRSIPDHNHTPDGTDRSCGTVNGESKYVARQEEMTVVIAVYQSDALSVSFPTSLTTPPTAFTDFAREINLLVSKDKALFRRFGPVFNCIDAPHVGDRGCGRPGIAVPPPRSPTPPREEIIPPGQRTPTPGPDR